MAQVIIVSRTRMADGFVCVGGVDVDNKRSVRLLDARGHHETAETCPYTIWDIWDIDYYLNQRRPNPHTEDVNVTRRMKIDRVDAPNMSVNRFAELMLNSNIPIFHGSLFSVFDGKLRRTDKDKLYISKEDVPTYSTCFWINDKRLLGYKNDRGRWQYRYTDMSNRYGYTISYVGSAEPLDTIEPGSLVRLSLAHWWQPEDSDDEERCYLQLSGCLIEEKYEEEALAKSENSNTFVEKDASSSFDHHVTMPVKEALKGLHCKIKKTGRLYEGTNIPTLSLSLSNKFQGQEELELSKDVFDAILNLLGDCIIKFNGTTGLYHVTLPHTNVIQNDSSSIQPEHISYIEKQKAIFPKAYSHWTDEDDQQLAFLFSEGKQIDELMTIFQRNRGSITARLSKLGLL